MPGVNYYSTEGSLIGEKPQKLWPKFMRKFLQTAWLLLLTCLIVGCSGRKPYWDNQIVFLVEPGFKGEISVVEAQGAEDPKREPGLYVLRVSADGVAQVPKRENLPNLFQMKAVVVPSPKDHAYSASVVYKEVTVTGGSSEVSLIGGVESRRLIFEIHP